MKRLSYHPSGVVVTLDYTGEPPPWDRDEPPKDREPPKPKPVPSEPTWKPNPNQRSNHG